ncbi:LysR family transcriptional regulator [Streptomyces diastatochromogenes]|uniref:LysR family transcriptional regulator n=1 Tax=Streptomyces diastatochromogenes TaxID=42236 RepID=A0A233SJE6_STRDA|nr:LysR family transcriptional regulator [Streptomyces diastatochromogenes]MCZ0988770.1 LysR family transcriptional regulator [Streptomyces diastatochromogenes]OXY95770.1 LysR family transcriptional regulator [Streptomyces diastatochromogenes]
METQANGKQLPSHADLNLLRTFLAVHRSGSFTAAAPLLGLSQPTVTAQIRTLEQQTGRELFTRLPRGVEPTPFAHELAGEVAGPLDALAALEGGAGPLTGHTAPVHLAGPSELLCVRVLPALAPLIARGVQVRVVQGLTEPLLEEMRAGRHDLVVATRRPRGRALPSAPLADEEYVLVASPVWAGHLPDGDPCTALREVPLVTYAEDLPIARRYWRTVFGKQLTARAALTVPNLYAVLSAVTAGAGYSVLPRSLCQDHLDTGRLALLHEPEEPPLNTLFLVQRPGAEANPDVVRVREALQRAAREW